MFLNSDELLPFLNKHNYYSKEGRHLPVLEPRQTATFVAFGQNMLYRKYLHPCGD
jgi:hypothetical protein